MTTEQKTLSEIKKEAWEIYKENNPPKGQARFYYKDNSAYWSDGFDAGVAEMQKHIQVLVDAIDDWTTDGEEEFNHQPAWQKDSEALQEYRKGMGGEMITGRSTGTGKYSYHERSSHNESVMVASMPEDQWKVRIIFRHNGESSNPLKIDERSAEMLWAALNSMSKDKGWKDLDDNQR